MAEIGFLFGVAFLEQTFRGIINSSIPAIGSGSGTGGAIENLTDGAVLGDAASGIGESGVSLSLGKKITEKAVLSGSFSRDFGNYVSRTVESFQITIPLKGNGNTTTTPVGADFEPDVGVAALYRAAGLPGGAIGAGWFLQPAATDLVSAGVYIGNESSNGVRVLIKDIEAKTMTFNFTPGEPATVTFDLSGVVESVDETGSWPAAPFEYGNQSTLSAPPVVDIAFGWGPDTPAARAIGFSELTVAFDLQSQTVKSSNAASGELQLQSGREITITGVIDQVDTDPTFELDQLEESDIANAEQITMLIGTAAGAAETANAIQFLITDPELIKYDPDRLGNSQAAKIELRARTSTADGEFSMILQ